MSAITTTVEEVLELIKTTAENSTVLSSYIKTANVYVTANLATAGLSAAVLAEVELYLSAHFTAIVEEKGGLIKEMMGDSSDTYADKFTKGLGLTRFGQMAMVLDTTGTLARLSANAGMKAEFRIV